HLILFFFQAEDGIRDFHVTGVQTCALPIFTRPSAPSWLRQPQRSAIVRRCPLPKRPPQHERHRRQREPQGSQVRRSPFPRAGGVDRKSVVEGKRVDISGRRGVSIIKESN